MKFCTTTALTFASLLLASPFAVAASSDDVEGENSLKLADCEIACSWGANSNRRHLRGEKEETFTMVEFKDAPHRSLGVELANIECTYTASDGTEYTNVVDFPDGWVEKYKEGDGAKDYYGFTTAFDIVADDGTAVGAVALQVEIESEEIESEDVITYDDQDIGVECGL